MNPAHLQLQQALECIRRGDLAAALAQADQAVKLEPKSPDAHRLVGTLLCQTGSMEQGVEHLQRSLKLVEHPTTRMNLAKALVALGRHEEAESAVAIRQAGPELARMHGDILKQRGKFAEAAAAYRRALSLNPSYADAWNNLGNTLRELDDISGAIEAFDRAAQLNPNAAVIRSNKAAALNSQERHDEALLAAEHALHLTPNFSPALLELGKALFAFGRSAEAIDALSRARAQEPTNVDILVVLAAVHTALDSSDKNAGRALEAETILREALRLKPDSSSAYFELATLFETGNRIEELEALFEEAEAAGVDPNTFALQRSLVLRRKGQLREALELVQNSAPAHLKPRVARASAIALIADRLGETDAAFAAMTEMNELSAQTAASRHFDRSALWRHIERVDALLTPSRVEQWRPLTLDLSRPAPTFLLGFPRSGTTLLDTALMGHPRVHVLEEHPLVRHLLEKLHDLGRLGQLSTPEVQSLRDAYFEEYDSLARTPEQDVIVDKMPLNTGNTMFLHRVFPDAKFLFALRHPCDVVLSCFMQSFGPNAAMASFFDLENAALLYDRIMTHWKRCNELLPITTHTLRYEALIEDAEGELKRVAEFIGVPWSDTLLKHDETAAERGRVRTASYAQVTEKLYTRAVGRWTRYREHMAPVLPILAPWVEHFGYSME